MEAWKHPVGITPLLLSLFATKFMTIEMLLVVLRLRMKMMKMIMTMTMKMRML